MFRAFLAALIAALILAPTAFPSPAMADLYIALVHNESAKTVTKR